MFTELGMVNGDQVTSVNGLEVNSDAEFVEATKGNSNMSVIRLEVFEGEAPLYAELVFDEGKPADSAEPVHHANGVGLTMPVIS